MRLLLATRNAHKALEVRRILASEGPRGCTVVTLEEAGIAWSEEEEGLEPYETFEENAESKARHFARRTGLTTVSDDSGLEVDALDGRPGVRTRRFAPPGLYPGLPWDEANNRHLLKSLEGIRAARRSARYVCVACLVDPRRDTVSIFRGEAPGRILTAPRGVGGFGYDPLFADPKLDRSYAELTPGEKDARSHRGRAFRALAAALRAQP